MEKFNWLFRTDSKKEKLYNNIFFCFVKYKFYERNTEILTEMRFREVPINFRRKLGESIDFG